jgi:hypothetical protein
MGNCISPSSRPPSPPTTGILRNNIGDELQRNNNNNNNNNVNINNNYFNNQYHNRQHNNTTGTKSKSTSKPSSLTEVSGDVPEIGVSNKSLPRVSSAVLSSMDSNKRRANVAESTLSAISSPKTSTNQFSSAAVEVDVDNEKQLNEHIPSGAITTGNATTSLANALAQAATSTSRTGAGGNNEGTTTSSTDKLTHISSPPASVTRYNPMDEFGGDTIVKYGTNVRLVVSCMVLNDDVTLAVLGTASADVIILDLLGGDRFELRCDIAATTEARGGEQKQQQQRNNNNKSPDTKTNNKKNPAILAPHGISAVAISQYDRLVCGAYTSDFTVRMWNLRRRRMVRVFEGHTSPVTSVIFTYGGKKIVTNANGTLVAWDFEGAPPFVLSAIPASSSANQQQSMEPQPVVASRSSLETDKDGNLPVMLEEKNAVIYLWNTNTGILTDSSLPVLPEVPSMIFAFKRCTILLYATSNRQDIFVAGAALARLPTPPLVQSITVTTNIQQQQNIPPVLTFRIWGNYCTTVRGTSSSLFLTVHDVDKRSLLWWSTIERQDISHVDLSRDGCRLLVSMADTVLLYDIFGKEKAAIVCIYKSKLKSKSSLVKVLMEMMFPTRESVFL